MKTVTAANFDAEVVGSDVPVVVKFWAEWCQPCKLLTGVFNKLAAHYGDRVKFTSVDADSESDLVSAMRIDALPTILVYKGGQRVQKLVGLQNEKTLRAELDSQL
jgi:thioredoxin 1